MTVSLSRMNTTSTLHVSTLPYVDSHSDYLFDDCARSPETLEQLRLFVNQRDVAELA
jgi:hypothetical protein